MVTKGKGNGSENYYRFVVGRSLYAAAESLLYFPAASQVKSKFLFMAFSALGTLALISIQYPPSVPCVSWASRVLSERHTPFWRFVTPRAFTRWPFCLEGPFSLFPHLVHLLSSGQTPPPQKAFRVPSSASCSLRGAPRTRLAPWSQAILCCSNPPSVMRLSMK